MSVLSEISANRPTTVSMPTRPTRPQFDRMKGAKWFASAQDQPVMILGQGGIGSWLSLLITRLGATIHTFDMDRYEAHNMTGQLVRNTDINRSKTAATMEICRLFNEHPAIVTNGEFNASSYTMPVMMCGLDNMSARKVAFKRWRDEMENIYKGTTEVWGYKSSDYDVRSTYLFIDGRLLAEQIQIFCIPGDRPDLIDKYETEKLFEDSEVDEVDCTFKQTSHAAAMIASHMVGFYTNWLTNVIEGDPEYRKLPFYYEYIIPFNLTMQDYANT